MTKEFINRRLFEDNAGGLHLAVLDEVGTCVWYLCSNHKEIISAAIDELRDGANPISEGWEGGEADPQDCYESILCFAEARNGGAWEFEV